MVMSRATNSVGFLSTSYPFALVGIHLAGLLHSWLQRGVLSRYLYTTTSQWPPTIEEFHEIFCELEGKRSLVANYKLITHVLIGNGLYWKIYSSGSITYSTSLLFIGYLFNRFDQFWLEKKPENVMVFPQLKKEFAEQVQELLSAKNITVLMRLQYTQ